MSGFFSVFLAALFIFTGQPLPGSAPLEGTGSGFALVSIDYQDRTHEQLPLSLSDLPSRESETSEENEVKDGCGDGPDAAYDKACFDQRSFFALWVIPFAQVSPSHKKRSTVSLIILHHSWKSFLA